MASQSPEIIDVMFFTEITTARQFYFSIHPSPPTTVVDDLKFD
jgi:hypothetical protein